MMIRQYSRLKHICQGFPRFIRMDSPEVLLMQCLCEGQAEKAAAILGESRQFGGKPVIDAPYGRFEGKKQILEFASGFLARFHADSAQVEPVVQTVSGGRSVTEMIVHFEVEGMINQVPMFVVGDLRAPDMLDEARIYCNFSRVPGLTPYRKPIFHSAHLEMGDPGPLTGAFREYYEALHAVNGVDVDRILASMGPGCLFGGYEPVLTETCPWEEPKPADPEELKRIYQHMATYIPFWVGMRYETLIDDGVTAVIEWQHIVTDRGLNEGGRIAMSGISAYSRGQDGLLCSIRICDYAGFEKQIDWTKTPVTREEAASINRVHFFPDGVGNDAPENRIKT